MEYLSSHNIHANLRAHTQPTYQPLMGRHTDVLMGIHSHYTCRWVSPLGLGFHVYAASGDWVIGMKQPMLGGGPQYPGHPSWEEVTCIALIGPCLVSCSVMSDSSQPHGL